MWEVSIGRWMLCDGDFDGVGWGWMRFEGIQWRIAWGLMGFDEVSRDSMEGCKRIDEVSRDSMQDSWDECLAEAFGAFISCSHGMVD